MDGSTLEYLGHLIAFSGDWERGCDLAERARQLNPNHPGWYWAVHFLDAYRKGEYQTARTYLLKSFMRGGGAQLFNQALLAALYGQLEERETDKAVREVVALNPDFFRTVRDEFGKWYLPELVEQLMDGLRKAGLEVVEAEQTALQGDTALSGTFAGPHATEENQSAIQPAGSPRQSIAVLPFVNISDDADNEYFCDGLAEELLNALSKIEGLHVAARSSAFFFKGKESDVREIGQRLNVTTVLEGGVRKSGNRLRITAQLVNIVDGYQLWSERYDREMQDIFDVQDEITLAVVEALKLKLFGDEKKELLKRYTDNTEVYELYLKGRYQSYKYSAEGWKRAIEFFEQAIDIQPDFAPAYAGLAAARGCLWFFGILPAAQTIPQCKVDNSKALALDNNLAEAYLSLAMITFFYDWQWEKAEHEFKQSIALNPNNAETLSYYAMFLAFEGRFDEASSLNKKSLKLDPLSPLINMNIGWNYFSTGNLDEASSLADKLIEMEPEFYGAYWLKGAIDLSEGDFAAAVEQLTKAVSRGGHQIVLADLASACSLAGKDDEAARILDQLLAKRREYVPAICLARIYSRIGEHEKAIEWLERAFEERNGEMVFLKGEIEGAAEGDALRTLANDPRLVTLLRKMKLP